MACNKKVKCPKCTMKFRVLRDGTVVFGRHIPTVCAEPGCGQSYFHRTVDNDAVVTIAASEVNPAWEIIGEADGNQD